jgi:hypothetical protein
MYRVAVQSQTHFESQLKKIKDTIRNFRLKSFRFSVMATSPRSRRHGSKLLKIPKTAVQCFIIFIGSLSGILLKGSYDAVSLHAQFLQGQLSSAMVETLSFGPDGSWSISRHRQEQREQRERELETAIQELTSLNGHKYVPCQPPNCGDLGVKRNHDTIVAFNSWNRPRYLCGERIDPHSFLNVKDATCDPNEGVRVFHTEPALTPIPSMDPIDLMVGTTEPMGRQPKKYDCSVPCQQWGDMSIYQPVYVAGTNIKFMHSMESSANYDFLQIDPTAWRKNSFYSTTSFQSEVPLPYFSWAEYEIQTPAVQYGSVIKGASFIASNCMSNNAREEVVKELMKIIRVDSVGSCLRNAELPPGSNTESKQSIQKMYLFHFAFENSNEVDYITEKLWGALQSGTLPVYMGAPNVQDHVPDHSIISWHDFPSTRKLGEYLQKVAADQTLYESYHAWRTKDLPAKFHRKYDMTRVHSACRACKFVYAKLHGFGWNSEKQDVQDLSMPRKVCLDQNGSITYPFVETVLSATTGSPAIVGSSTNCKPTSKNPTLARMGSWQRTVWFHDGVIDITLLGKSDGVYRIVTPLTAHFKILRTNVYQVQDKVSRMTIVGDPGVRMSARSKGALDIRSYQTSTSESQLRVRVIVEDVDTLHVGADTVQNYFGAYMVNEFEHPLLFLKATNLIL